MVAVRCRFRAIALLAAAALPVGARIEAEPFSAAEFPFDPPAAESAVPQLAFELVSEVPLAGPLPGEEPRRVDGRVVVRTADGDVVTAVEAGPGDHSLAGDGDWVQTPNGRMRYRAVADRIVAEKQCKRCRRGWKQSWRVRVAGPAPPLPLDDRVCYGALDNFVYCLNPRNGHRLWMTDVEGRITRRLVEWTGDLPPAQPAEPPRQVVVVLAVVDAGSKLVALGAADGRQLASVDLGDDEGAFVAVPLAAPDGRVVVARQWYRKDKASLMVYRLTRPPPPPIETEAPAEVEPVPPDVGSGPTTSSGPGPTVNASGRPSASRRR